jgi:Ca-activated chloride channel family protein
MSGKKIRHAEESMGQNRFFPPMIVRHSSRLRLRLFVRVSVLLGIAVVCLDARQRPSFRSTIDLVMLNVTVTGPGGRYVSDLSADDFQVLEDGRPQDVAYFSPANVPLSVSLVLDTSSSMDEEMALSKQAAMDFIARLRPGDIAEVVSFDSRVEVLQPMTSDRALLEDAIQRMRAGGSTALYNGVYIVLRQLDKIKPQSGDDVRRQVIVVLSDGEDTSSLVTFEHLLDSAKRSQTVIYTVGLGLEEPTRVTRSDGEFGLRQLAQETGGRLFLPKRPTDLVDVYTQIANELTNQYMVGYLSSNARADGAWRRIAVRVLRPNLQARTRAGYYAATN